MARRRRDCEDTSVRHGRSGPTAQPRLVARALRLQRGGFERLHGQVAHAGGPARGGPLCQVREREIHARCPCALYMVKGACVVYWRCKCRCALYRVMGSCVVRSRCKFRCELFASEVLVSSLDVNGWVGLLLEGGPVCQVRKRQDADVRCTGFRLIVSFLVRARAELCLRSMFRLTNAP